METMYTLRLYDADFVAKLGALIQREEENYRNKNEFLTALLMLGYEQYAAARGADGRKGAPAISVPANLKELKLFLGETSGLLADIVKYLAVQFKALTVYHSVTQKLLSANHRMLLALSGGGKVIPSKVEDGFFDDLPERFEEIIAELGTKFGLT